MKNLLLILLIALAFRASAQIGTINHIDEKNGFAGIKLSDTITNIKLKTIPQMGYSKPDEYGITSYILADDSLLKLDGDFAFDSIMLNFIDGKLYSINFYFYSSSVNKVISILKSAYGNPTTNTLNKDGSLVWSGRKNSAIIHFDLTTKKQYFTISNNLLNSKYQTRYEATIKRSANRF